MITCGKKYGFILLLIFLAQCVQAQVRAGKVVYERKTNLYKKFKGDDVKEWLREEDKNKVDVFELYFDDSSSLFQPQESELKERMSWATSKNKVYRKLNAPTGLFVKSIWGEQLYISDTVPRRQWKITDSKRTISGYVCRKAIWQQNDTTRIYAWYCDELMPSIGPESFGGLPGVILGLATEDGGVIYFAKSVETSPVAFDALVPKPGKSKIYSNEELRIKLQKDFGKNPWGKAMIKEVFAW